MYPIGVLFGLGFDTASETALLALSAAGIFLKLPLWNLLVFPFIIYSGNESYWHYRWILYERSLRLGF
ncbi:HoxN/HupN/NixA family nickel/cobalt transporter [Saccharolobus shibatae B12]|uniref:Nickel/cobalt efflux system n=1 Tax=Saccharolobus shibatae (strain ATCC 51178 / DSM 5389 / JCM 8931 / NBRC 15437 / B12) TaxID=523848 RepID=A0A8F5BQ14_SACSH|nr:hypothetical protein [Saccharolobus shibatae]QXJ29183.1 HoxN/HupN/NixA family nickel/cobalt transporter [Saccharolobus shibatae B12]